MSKKKNTADPAERLARFLMEAHIEAIVECDPHRGYYRVAERLLRRGVKLPIGEE